MWALSDFVLRFEASGIPPNGRGYVATRPSYDPLLILYPSLKCWGPPTWQGLCSPEAHLWASCDFIPCSETLGSPQMAGVM